MVLSFDSLKEFFSDTSSFYRPIKENQLGPDSVKSYLLLDFWNKKVFEVPEAIKKSVARMKYAVFSKFGIQIKIVTL